MAFLAVIVGCAAFLTYVFTQRGELLVVTLDLFVVVFNAQKDLKDQELAKMQMWKELAEKEMNHKAETQKEKERTKQVKIQENTKQQLAGFMARRRPFRDQRTAIECN